MRPPCDMAGEAVTSTLRQPVWPLPLDTGRTAPYAGIGRIEDFGCSAPLCGYRIHASGLISSKTPTL